MTRTILILGASGRAGRNAAEAFAAAGWQVRRFDRKRDDLIKAAKGSDVIFNGMNPPNYENWAENIPRITRDAIHAARSSGATLIVPGNVYIYGAAPGPWSEDTATQPNSVKGRVRVEMEESYRAAARDGLQVILLRAGDFIDPGDGGDAMSLIYLRAIARDRLTAAGNPAVTRAYAYMPDFARAAVMLAEIRDRLGAYEDIPFPGHAFSLLDLKAELERRTGRALRLSKFPWWLIRALSPVWPLARELMEMRYLWSLEHRLDGGKFARLLPEFQSTSFEEVVAGSLAAERSEKAPSTASSQLRTL